MPTVEERKASLEIIGKMPVLFISRLPILPQGTRRKIIGNAINGMSKQSFDLSSSYLVELVDNSKKQSQKFQSAWAETYGIIKEFPRLQPFKNKINDRVKAYRRKYHLPI